MGNSVFYILSEEKIYFLGLHYGDVHASCNWFSNALFGELKENTLAALLKFSVYSWSLRSDLVYPFGDPRMEEGTYMMTFDIDNDMLYLDEMDHSYKRPLSHFRTTRFNYADYGEFEVYKRPARPVIDLQRIFPAPHWKPDGQITERTLNYVGRIFVDFAYQWGHLLRNNTSESTFRRLATGIIRIATLNFCFDREFYNFSGGTLKVVSIHDLPTWEPFSEKVVPVGSARVVLSQDLESSISLIREDFANLKNVLGQETSNQSPSPAITYLVLSVRHVVLCRMNGTLEYSQPEPLFEGNGPPSSEALRLLLLPFQSSYEETSLHRLPLEIQSLILKKSFLDAIEGGRLGCLLDLGMPYPWRENGETVEREEYRRGSCAKPIQHKIMFDDCSSGICYKSPAPPGFFEKKERQFKETGYQGNEYYFRCVTNFIGTGIQELVP